ncbi:hypothetical protein AB0M44_12025 [Streptosporangium subroseum]|uniref:hypothetical protein n=1 Tax=Streptosporangium subroseum TaxID=106412 RepID=UPI00341E50EF
MKWAVRGRQTNGSDGPEPFRPSPRSDRSQCSTYKVAALEQAQAAGLVSAVLPPEQLLDQILTLTHGHPVNAGDAASWTDGQRRALAVGVAALTGQPPGGAT